jgi:hypothetical protein
VKIGAFRCTSKGSGITCVVRSSGRGFRIDEEAVVAVH